MLDLSAVSYRLVVMDENGKQYDIREYVQNLGWEENENEIAVRSSFTVRNDSTAKGYLSSLIKPGCLIGIFASDGTTSREVARGYVEDWTPAEQSSGNTLRCLCYDELYRLQKSQDNRFFQSGTGTRSAIESILDDWEIPQDEYQGPDVSHGKMKYNNSYLSDIILELLDDAAKHGEEQCMIRAAKGRTSVIPYGSNSPVYVFRADNTKSFSGSVSTENLITRVIVVGQSDDEGCPGVDATVNGLTEYGIRQRIYTRGSDESIEDAQSAAQEIISEDGKISRKMTVQSPDVPFIRKGDLVYIISGTASDYYFVRSIQHDADTGSMTMTAEIAEQDTGSGGQDSSGTSGASGNGGHNVGDVVNFHGGTHYVSSSPGAKGYSARPGQAKITKKNGSGKAHPWHLIHTDSTSNVYGWVDDGTFD